MSEQAKQPHDNEAVKLAETPVNEAAQTPETPANALQSEKRREYTKREQILPLLALAIGVLFDRLVIYGILGQDTPVILMLWASFWLCYLVIFYAYHWMEIRGDKILWVIAAFAVLLCVWNYIHLSGYADFALYEGDYNYYLQHYANWSYASLTTLVVPAVLMAHAQIFAHKITQRQLCRMVIFWLRGFFVTPFNAILHLPGALRFGSETEKRPLMKKLLVAVGISLLLLVVILPLLLSADMVFRYFFEQTLGNFDIGELALHLLIIVLATLLFFSFFWNTDRAHLALSKEYAGDVMARFRLETLILHVVLSVIVVVYLLFCAVQFTYLFAQAGLPAGMSYVEHAEYTREGFAQMVAVCVINLLIFGFCVFCDRKSKLLTGLLCGLLGVTGVILVSGFVRLNLYVAVYGMTWLRLLSTWFIFYLGAVILLCLVRLFWKRLPVVFISGMLLLVWYTVLGYANPQVLIGLSLWG